MLQVLENALDKFKNNPSVHAALLSKIGMIYRESEYASFILSLKNKDWINALCMARKSPWIIPEFIKLAAGDVFYHAHRIRHRGNVRGTR